MREAASDMSLPWEGGTPPVPPPVPVVARNPVTGEQVRVDVGKDLREAIKQAINSTVMENRPTLAHVASTVQPRFEGAFRGGFFTDRTLLHGAVIDLAVAVLAALATYVSPESGFSKGAWLVVGALAAKTVMQAGLSFATKVKEVET